MNLRHKRDPQQDDELELLKQIRPGGTKLKYLRLESDACCPDEEILVKFLKLGSEAENLPVFVHCEAGKDRTGYTVVTYRSVNQDWNKDDAILEMSTFGHDLLDPLLFDDQVFLKKLNRKHILNEVNALKPSDVGILEVP